MKAKGILIGVLVVFNLASSRDMFVIPNHDNSGIYEHKIRVLSERPVFYAGTKDRLQIIASEDRFYRVKTADGREGWIEQNICSKAINGTRFMFEPADVYSHMENPVDIFILDVKDPTNMYIELKRSFKDEVRENVDKEFIERLAGKM